MPIRPAAMAIKLRSVKINWICIAPGRETSKGVFIVTQLNSTELN